MPREKRPQEEIFSDIVKLQSYIGFLKGIVQNTGATVSDHEIMRWSDDVNVAINKLSSLREDVIRFYQD